VHVCSSPYLLIDCIKSGMQYELMQVHSLSLQASQHAPLGRLVL